MHKPIEDKTHAKLVASASRRIEQVLKSAFEDGTCFERNDSSRAFRLRPSSFPFCPLRFFLDLPDMLTKGKRIPSTMAYYVRVGHVIHGVFQEAVSTHSVASQFFIRDWKCAHCKHLHVLTTVPEQCAKCSKPFHVHEAAANIEHTVEHGNLVGHVDDAFGFTRDGNDYLVVVDYKSTSLARLSRKGVLPERSHIEQLAAYSALLNKRIHVLGYVLVYIPRDNPHKLKAFSFLLQQPEAQSILKKIAVYEQQHKFALAATDIKSVNRLIEKRVCRSSDDVVEFCGKCRYEALCSASSENTAKSALYSFALDRLKKRQKHGDLKPAR